MATADELRASVAAARTVLRTAIIASADAWETPKGSGEDGGPGWSPRQVAEHAIPSEMMFANSICAACGYDGPENPLSSTEFATAEDALAALDAVSAARRLESQTRAGQRAGQHTQRGGRWPPSPSRGLMVMDVWHLADHASQMLSPMG